MALEESAVCAPQGQAMAERLRNLLILGKYWLKRPWRVPGESFRSGLILRRACQLLYQVQRR
jgi:hypothetical protein